MPVLLECMHLPEALYNELRGKSADVHNEAFIFRNVGDTEVFVQLSWLSAGIKSIPRGKAFIKVDDGSVMDYGTVDYSAHESAAMYPLKPDAVLSIILDLEAKHWSKARVHLMLAIKSASTLEDEIATFPPLLSDGILVRSKMSKKSGAGTPVSLSDGGSVSDVDEPQCSAPFNAKKARRADTAPAADPAPNSTHFAFAMYATIPLASVASDSISTSGPGIVPCELPFIDDDDRLSMAHPPSVHAQPSYPPCPDSDCHSLCDL